MLFLVNFATCLFLNCIYNEVQIAYLKACLDSKTLSNYLAFLILIPEFTNLSGGNMLLQSKFFRVVSIFIITLGLAVFAFADTIRLKDGSVIKGKIITFDKGQFIIVIGEGTRQRQMRFFADEIESITFDSETVPNMSANTEIKDSTTATTDVPKKPNYEQTTDGNTTIITVGSAPRTSNPQTSSPPVYTTNDDDDEITDDDVVDNTPTNTDSPAAKPIQIKVKVLADNTSNGWTNAGWVVRKGQRLRIVSNGRISLGNGRYSGPRGISTLPDENKLIKDQPTGSLIAVIGDDNNDFIYIGEGREFVAQRDGALFLGVNEGLLNDNSGSFEVTLEIETTDGN